MLTTVLKQALFRMSQLPKREHQKVPRETTWEKRKRTGFALNWKKGRR